VILPVKRQLTRAADQMIFISFCAGVHPARETAVDKGSRATILGASGNVKRVCQCARGNVIFISFFLFRCVGSLSCTGLCSGDDPARAVAGQLIR
jgi:hypothetical protein